MTVNERGDNEVIPDVIAEHLASLASLFEMWKGAVIACEYELRTLQRIEERIEAHVDGLREGGDHARALARERLTVETPEEVFSAAYVLLCTGEGGTIQQVVGHLMVASRPAVARLGEALGQAPMAAAVVARLRELFGSAPAPMAIAVAQALAMHDQLDPNARRLQEFFFDENPEVRAGAWRVAAILDSVGRRSAPLQDRSSPE